MPKKDRAYSVRIPPQVWEGQKDRILALYKEHILCKVLEKITTTEFSPSESQLREKLKEWGSKKRLSGKERKKINREIESKMVPIEQCEVVVHGEVQPAEKTCREYARTCNRGYRGLSPGLPGHIQIRTPPVGRRSWVDFYEGMRVCIWENTRWVKYALGRVSVFTRATTTMDRFTSSSGRDALLAGDPLSHNALEEALHNTVPFSGDQTHDISSTLLLGESGVDDDLELDDAVDETSKYSLALASSIPEWPASEREAVGIFPDESRRHGWDIFFGWND